MDKIDGQDYRQFFSKIRCVDFALKYICVFYCENKEQHKGLTY